MTFFSADWALCMFIVSGNIWDCYKFSHPFDLKSATTNRRWYVCNSSDFKAVVVGCKCIRWCNILDRVYALNVKKTIIKYVRCQKRIYKVKYKWVETETRRISMHALSSVTKEDARSGDILSMTLLIISKYENCSPIAYNVDT